jgi:hypothetical protein
MPTERQRRFVWAPDANVYHDRLYDTEECNVDDIVRRQEGDEPPVGRTLCEHCQAQADFEANLGHGDTPPA